MDYQSLFVSQTIVAVAIGVGACWIFKLLFDHAFKQITEGTVNYYPKAACEWYEHVHSCGCEPKVIHINLGILTPILCIFLLVY